MISCGHLKKGNAQTFPTVGRDCRADAGYRQRRRIGGGSGDDGVLVGGLLEAEANVTAASFGGSVFSPITCLVSFKLDHVK